MKRGGKKYLKFAANEVELDHQAILKDEAADGFYEILISHEDMKKLLSNIQNFEKSKKILE
ncbi:hypothetical protein K6989_02595 [Mycoplasmopsis synoviae]|uniref:hypothetical protein n=1 Tax=Mycoplasmopsis synoviae TaxID=2109 RepID=UPI001CE21273|nr:hypothetical protein [Mycoplasmopsis synoviae]UBX97253.1 hypothetical protein K6989_02595 [Mycoplasmopsis synoviae]UBX97944.1 hypothetical protein K6987_02815 [Mycoplasmopsis synoviae]UBX98878.1 hypothetical protein K6986_00765 [Mycoplasmopsis synoviae]